MAAKNIEFEISDNEKDIDLVAAAATKFSFENAREKAKAFLEKDDDFNKLHQCSKELTIKYMVNKIVEETVNKFKEEINKRNYFF